MEQIFFMPHGHCFYWNPVIITLMVVGNALIALAYFIISFLLERIRSKNQAMDKKDTPIWVLFAAFILFCGIGHLIKLANIWLARYWIESIWDLLTGIVSMWTVWILISRYQDFKNLQNSNK